MDKDFLSWAAGFFEGEGHASIQKIRRGYQIHVYIASSDPEPVKWFLETWGGRWMERPTEYRDSSGKFKRGKVQYKLWFNWRLSGKLLRDIHPYLRTSVKKKVISVVIEAIERHEKVGDNWHQGKGLMEDLHAKLWEVGYTGRASSSQKPS